MVDLRAAVGEGCREIAAAENTERRILHEFTGYGAR